MAKRSGRTSSKLSKVSVVELAAELQRRGGELAELQQRHQELVDELQQVEAVLAALGGMTGNGHAPNGHRAASGRIQSPPPGRTRAGGRKRPKNEMNLVDALAQVLATSTMSVTEAAEAVQRAGYKTTSPSFRTIVNQTLINSGKFKRVDRGRYTVK